MFGKHTAYIYDVSDFEYQMIYATLLTYGSHGGSVLIFILFLGFETVEFGQVFCQCCWQHIPPKLEQNHPLPHSAIIQEQDQHQMYF